MTVELSKKIKIKGKSVLTTLLKSGEGKDTYRVLYRDSCDALLGSIPKTLKKAKAHDG